MHTYICTYVTRPAKINYVSANYTELWASKSTNFSQNNSYSQKLILKILGSAYKFTSLILFIKHRNFILMAFIDHQFGWNKFNMYGEIFKCPYGPFLLAQSQPLIYLGVIHMIMSMYLLTYGVLIRHMALLLSSRTLSG